MCFVVLNSKVKLMAVGGNQSILGLNLEEQFLVRVAKTFFV